MLISLKIFSALQEIQLIIRDAKKKELCPIRPKILPLIDI